MRYCTAPCIVKITRDAYLERVEEACSFLRGERKDVLAELEAEMRTAAEARDFERSAELRDTLLKLRKTISRRVLGTKHLEVKRREADKGILEI